MCAVNGECVKKGSCSKYAELDCGGIFGSPCNVGTCNPETGGCECDKCFTLGQGCTDAAEFWTAQTRQPGSVVGSFGLFAGAGLAAGVMLIAVWVGHARRTPATDGYLLYE